MAEGGYAAFHRIYRKTTVNNKLKLYVARRDLVLEPNRVERLEGLIFVDPEYAENRNVYGQIIIKTRYGANESALLELESYEESILHIVKIWPPCEKHQMNVTSKCLRSLARRLGPNASLFHIEISNNAPPSLSLFPGGPYDGPPVGVKYDVGVFLAEAPGDKVSLHDIVRMSIRVSQSAAGIDNAPLITPEPSLNHFRVMSRYRGLKVHRRKESDDEDDLSLIAPDTDDEFVPIDFEFNENNIQYNEDQESNKKDEDKESKEMGKEGSENKEEEEEQTNKFDWIKVQEEVTVDTDPEAAAAPRAAPHLAIKKSFYLGFDKVHFESWLDKSSYHHGEKIKVHFLIINNTRKTIRRIEAKAIQKIDVYLFGKGTFKNVVAEANDDSSSVPPEQMLVNFYTMTPCRVQPKKWLAVEDLGDNLDGRLASTVICPPLNARERRYFSIFVTYYVKISVHIDKSGLLSLKLPFSLSER